MSSMRVQDSGEFPWGDLEYRRYMDPLLACGQLLARSLGHSKAPAGSPLLADQLLEDRGALLFAPETLDVLRRCRRKGEGAEIHLALRALDLYVEGDSYPLGIPGAQGPVVLGLLSLLGAGYLLEAMPNAFANPAALFALLDPMPSSWLGMISQVRALVRSSSPLLWVWDPGPFRRACYGAQFGLTPRGMAFFGVPPEEAYPRPRSGSGEEMPFPDRRWSHRRKSDPQRELKGDPHSRPGKGRSPESEETTREVLALENPRLSLEDLILPEDARTEVAFAAKVLEAGGDPPVMLFHGPPGTGKTHAARCLAGASGRPLGITSMDRLMNKWVGDTEKGISRAFSEAEDNGAVLLLDEADALLYDRSTMVLTWQLSQVNTLLKLLEKPKVPVILCTNLLRVLDGALHRRVQYMVEFPVPGFEERRNLWEYVALELLGSAADLDLDELAAVPLTGGLIRNALQQAARRQKVLGREFSADTPALLALARKELPKMDRDARAKTIGFSHPDGPEGR
jgi:hypothetical protein